MKNIKNYRNIKFIITEAKTNYIMSKPNNHLRKKNLRNFISNKDTHELTSLLRSINIGKI